MKSMKFLNILSAISVISFSSSASTPTWLNIFTNENGKTRVVATPLDDISEINFSKDDDNADYYSTISVVRKNGETKAVSMDNVTDYSLGTNVPTIYINTKPEVEEISSKTEYLPATFSMECYGNYEDVDDVSVNIRGRGNSTWSFSKKPYRLKFDKKISLCGLTKAKSFVLIANYVDGTLMKNAIAFKIGQLLEMPFTNHSIPVSVVLNGRYKGAYMLSEKIGINSGSVNIDEEKGILWELDTHFDEDYKFHSQIYNLPVMVKDPDLLEVVTLQDDEDREALANELFHNWQTDFEKMEAAIKNGIPETELDMDQAVNYILANVIVRNGEIGWPKSVYLFKENISRSYKLGPLWDYDWAFDFIDYKSAPYNSVLLYPQNRTPGDLFFYDLTKTQIFKDKFEDRWKYFKEELFPLLLDYIDTYADQIRVSALQNGERWPGTGPDDHGISSEDFDNNVSTLKSWLINRVTYLDTAPNHGIYR